MLNKMTVPVSTLLAGAFPAPVVPLSRTSSDEFVPLGPKTIGEVTAEAAFSK